ncbi:IgA peptidase M64-domain-containing protein [Crucibulum laeve]|uniref:IgA peptidase M64-domain-containing protein n=1 Tax=Crucibulum laeve TaxID=68775 RepID=A0A5C3M0Z0_9AGAR|nr:IgA peptidase M64-domain-containing protein [Crucibulum laeve]
MHPIPFWPASQIDRKQTPKVPSPPLQIVPLIISGSSHNRVDLVFFSDGYLEEEYDKFIQDAGRLAQDVSGNQTFNTVKPLLNFWAAFSPSKESGIGVGGVPKDTPFGLFRDGTELRGVYYSKPEAARAACDSMSERCDFPILLGNDPFYGGLGGEFTVITSSLLNGPLVLRHELGHSIIDVGEEYDGGYAYFGVNAAHDASKPIPWSHWLSDPPTDDEITAPRVERSVMPMQAYPWTMLNNTSPWSITFTSSGSYARHLVRFSLSGLPEKTDLNVELDGDDLGWVPEPNVGLDRWHYDVHRDGGLAAGEHTVNFTLVNGDREGFAQLCSVEILEFGDEEEFVSTPGYYSLFPTYSDTNETSFRPTNEDCLMRVVTSPNFCSVCTEGLWLSLLKRVDLIDNVTENCEWRSDPHSGGIWIKTINLHLLPLAQLRTDTASIKSEESYTITWKRAGIVMNEFTNRTRLEIDDGHALGRYTISVQFTTDEVRLESDLLASSLQYNVMHKCGS